MLGVFEATRSLRARAPFEAEVGGGGVIAGLREALELLGLGAVADVRVPARAAQESDIPNFKGSYLGHFPLVSADFWTSDHLSERSRRVSAFSGTRARGTLTLKRR